MQLSPLQSRLAASLGASLVLLAIYLFLYSPHFALAAEFGGDGVGPILDGEVAMLRPGLAYESDFTTEDGSIVGEAPADVVPLMNNIPVRLSLEPGTSARLVFANSAPPSSEEHLDLRRDEPSPSHGSRAVFVSANTCRHPEGEGIEAPQLQIAVSQEVSGAMTDGFEEGAAMRKVDATGNVYVVVVAPEAPAPLTGSYTLELAASTDGWYHSYSSEEDGGAESELQWVDSDSKGALLRTRSLGLDESPSDREVAHDAVKDDPPYSLFLEKHGSNDINGVRRSYCGLQTYATISAVGHGRLSDTIEVTTTALGHLPGLKQQFHIQGLSPGSSYSAILVHTGRRSLAKRGEGQVGGGGRVLETRQVNTKSGENCAIPTGLKFCTNVDYAVPTNSNKFNSTTLGKFYEDYVTKMYGYFNNSLAQIPCQAPDEARYSLARDCDDCSLAYKNWLCAVAFPRCEDFNSTNPFTQVRNVAQDFPDGTRLATAGDFTNPAEQASRNAFIDEGIAPGPYREVLPCDDVCYLVVQSCHAALGFTCPMPGMKAYEQSYGRRQESGKDVVPCNFPGSSTEPSSAGLVAVPWTGLAMSLVLVVMGFI